MAVGVELGEGDSRLALPRLRADGDAAERRIAERIVWAAIDDIAHANRDIVCGRQDDLANFRESALILGPKIVAGLNVLVLVHGQYSQHGIDTVADQPQAADNLYALRLKKIVAAGVGVA